MGFDLTAYDVNQQRIANLAMSESLHEEIFDRSKHWTFFPVLRQIRDYYKTNKRFKPTEIAALSEALQSIKQYYDVRFHAEFDEIGQYLSNPSIQMLHICGD